MMLHDLTLNQFFPVLGKIYENVLFFGDVLLRMPDMTKKVWWVWF